MGFSAPRIIVIVSKSRFSPSPWDSYVKYFADEGRFFDWWHELDEGSYTRKLARVRMFSIDLGEELHLLAPHDARELPGS